MNAQELKKLLPHTAFAFRGYDIANLGRTPELLEHPKFGAVIEQWLHRAEQAHQKALGVAIDLKQRLSSRRETTAADYSESIALIIAVEQAQLQIMREHFDIAYSSARVSFGYSLGEIAAVIAGGVLKYEDAIRIPLELSSDCLALTENVTLAVLLTKAAELPLDDIERAIVHVNSEGRGAMGISTFLSPSAAIVLGQADTLDRFKKQAGEMIKEKLILRKRDECYPPLHTSLTWQGSIPSRAALMLQTLPFVPQRPEPPILSMVTGLLSYNDHNFGGLLARWVDHPQRVWDVTVQTLSMGVEAVVHVGPAPNLLPATWSRLKENVESQTRSSFSMRALAAAARRPWLAAMLPQQTSLLRAPEVKQIILEDWLLENA